MVHICSVANIGHLCSEQCLTSYLCDSDLQEQVFGLVSYSSSFGSMGWVLNRLMGRCISLVFIVKTRLTITFQGAWCLRVLRTSKLPQDELCYPLSLSLVSFFSCFLKLPGHLYTVIPPFSLWVSALIACFIILVTFGEGVEFSCYVNGRPFMSN